MAERRLFPANSNEWSGNEFAVPGATLISPQKTPVLVTNPEFFIFGKIITMKPLKTPVLAIFFAFSFAVLGQAQEGQALEYGKKYSLASKVLNENRTYWVHLPASYHNPKQAPQRYPVMYVLDGKSVFFPLLGVVSFMSEKESVNFQIPEMIVVGIDTEHRIRDLTPNPSSKQPNGQEASTESQKLMMQGSGGGETFLQFLTKELFPKIEAEYRTLPYRVYVGHSLGGLTSTFSLLKHPGLFDGYLAIDPSLWWDGAKYVNEAPTDLKNYGTSKVQRFYLSVVEAKGEPIANFHVASIHKLGEQLKNHAPQNLHWKVDVIPNTDHSSIPLLSWYQGLQFIFAGYDVNHYTFMQDPDLIEKHYAKLEKELGLKMSPPEDVFEILIHYTTAPNRFPDPEKAKKLIEMGLKYHPSSPYLQAKSKEMMEK
jgi:predicted alpha/beta superfamily hydrolase